jgi:hypothetical protein
MTRALCILLLALAAACSKPTGIQAELLALRAAGHPPAGFQAVDATPFKAQTCQGGTIDRFAAVLCEYKSPDALGLGQQAAEGWIGQAVTGVVLRRDLFLLALADRDRVDPSGKALSALAKAFRRTPPADKSKP